MLTITYIIVYNVNIIRTESEIITMSTNNTITKTNTTNINIRIDKDVKQEAENLFNELGLTISGAINLFFRQAIRERANPFRIKAKTDEERYNEYFTPEMVRSILDAEERMKQGNYISFTFDELLAMEDGDIPQRAIDFLNANKKAVRSV